VAHYLIQSRRSQTNLEDSGNETLASPEGSQLSELLDTDKSPDGLSKPQPEDYIFDNCDKDDGVDENDELKKEQEGISEPFIQSSES
jgi:hypothetical protein